MIRQAVMLGLVLVLTAPAGSAQTLTEADREFAVTYLEETRAAIVEATEGLSEAQWHFKTAPDRWSVAECLEHIAAVEDALFDFVDKQVMATPALEAERADAKEIDKFVLTFLPDRSRRFQAPEPLRPTERFGTPQKTLEHFLASRARTVEFAQTNEELRAHAVESPLGKTLDGYQWVLYIAAHSERHTKQLKEVMADANFPNK